MCMCVRSMGWRLILVVDRAVSQIDGYNRESSSCDVASRDAEDHRTDVCAGLIVYSDVGRIAAGVAGYRESAERCIAVERLDLRGELRRSVRLDKRADPGNRGAHTKRQRSVAAIAGIRSPHEWIA